MAPTAAQIAQLRRMVAEPAVTPYSDAILTTYIERYKLMDENGQPPYTYDSATPPAQVVNADWVASYDLNAAASDIWAEKAAGVAALYDFNADGADYSRSQQYDQYMKNARYYRARRSMTTTPLIQWPKETDNFAWIGNLPEEP